ncbi:MAG: hypothetical protein MI923_25645 [Phycisphaerales bacterium]|nr:hypothetical protein [Phycisphaerales bacterium]
MEESPTSTISEEAPPGMEDQEVEQLLDQATSLTTEIVTDAGSDSESGENDEVTAPDDAASPPNDPETPDVEEAVSQTEDQIKELNDLLNDPDEQAPTDSEENDDAPTPDPEADSTTGELQHEPSDSPDGDQETSDSDQAPKSKRSIKQNVKAISARAFRIGISVPITIVNSFLNLWILLDRPFAKVPMGLKHALGITAIATLVAAIAAWALPELLNRNPFEDMER